MNTKVYSKDFIKLGLLVFAGFGMDMLLLFLEQNIYKTNSLNFTQSCIHSIMISIIWGIIGFRLLRRAKVNLNFNPFENNEKPSSKDILVVIGLLILCMIIGYVSWGYSFKPSVELNSNIDKFGTSGIITFVLQYIYYVFEAVLITLSIIFGQKAGELASHKMNIPWGGIFLALTWGVMHTFSKDLSTGIWAFSNALIYGITFLLMKKNVKYSYIFIYLMFIL